MNEWSSVIRIGLIAIAVWSVAAILRRQRRLRRESFDNTGGAERTHTDELSPASPVLRTEKKQLIAVWVLVGAGVALIILAPWEPPLWVVIAAVVVAAGAVGVHLVLEARKGWAEIRDIIRRARHGGT